MAQENQGMQDVFTDCSDFNKLKFIIEQTIKQMVNTSALVRVDGCTSQGSSSGAGTVSATPLVAQTDAQGNALPMATIANMPHARVQGGIAALIIDPVAGDIGVASFCKQDSSTVKEGTTDPQRPGSFRSFSQADGMLVATVTNKAPEVWIELKQDKTIIIHAPEGVTIETDKSVEINAGESVKIKAGKDVTIDTPILEVTGSMITGTDTGGAGGVTMRGHLEIEGDVHSTADQIAGTVSQMQHTHKGVQPGSGNTAEPNA